MKTIKPGNLESLFKDDIEHLAKEMKAIRLKHQSEDDLINSKEWQDIRTRSDKLMEAINNRFEEIQDEALARIEANKILDKRIKGHRDIPIPIAVIIIMLFIIAIIYSAS